MSDVIDFATKRNEREAPAPEFVTQDEFGRPMFTFLLQYQMGGDTYMTEIVAYDETDAKRRVDAMRESLAYEGQLFAAFPA